MYLRHLTASQYRTFQWNQIVQQRIKATAELIDAGGRLVSDVQPLFDQLLHYLEMGDAPFNRTTISALDCSIRTDLCGVCGGTGNTCGGCDNVPLSTNVFDVCGKCTQSTLAGSSCNSFCDGAINSGKVADMCGVCGGDDSSCTGCDNIINSGLVFDRCGVCGGDGMSCDKAIGEAQFLCPYRILNMYLFHSIVASLTSEFHETYSSCASFFSIHSPQFIYFFKKKIKLFLSALIKYQN
jgi:hypothetical protein